MYVIHNAVLIVCSHLSLSLSLSLSFFISNALIVYMSSYYMCYAHCIVDHMNVFALQMLVNVKLRRYCT